jgi:hypothetical protein
MRCSTCHGDENNSLKGIPGAPGMAPCAGDHGLGVGPGRPAVHSRSVRKIEGYDEERESRFNATGLFQML